MINMHISFFIALLLLLTVTSLYVGYFSSKYYSESKLTKGWSHADWAIYRDWKRVPKNLNLSIVDFANEKLHYSKATILIFQNQMEQINRQRFGLENSKLSTIMVQRKQVPSHRSTDSLNNIIKFPTNTDKD